MNEGRCSKQQSLIVSPIPLKRRLVLQGIRYRHTGEAMMKIWLVARHLNLSLKHGEAEAVKSAIHSLK